MSVSADVNQLYVLSKSEDDMDIDYNQVCLDLLDAERQTNRRKRRQEMKLEEIKSRFWTLASCISSPRPREIQAACEQQEVKYENNVLNAKIEFGTCVNQKCASLYIQIAIPEDVSVDPKLSFENGDGDTILLNYSEDLEAMIIEQLRSLL